MKKKTKESELIESIEAGEWKSVKNLQSWKIKLKKAASAIMTNRNL